MSNIKVTSEIENIKIKLDSIYTSIEPLTNILCNNLDAIRGNWKGQRSDDVLKSIEEIKKNTIKIKDNLQKNIDFINEAYKKYKELEAASTTQAVATDTPIPIVATETPSPTVTPEPIVTPLPTDVPKYTVSPGTMSFYDFESIYLKSIIDSKKNGQNSFDTYDLESFLKTYNMTPNSATVSKDNPNYLQDSANSLYSVQKSIKEAGLWGTPAATRIVALWMINTGFKIPVTASTKTDGLGNQRGIGIGDNWNVSGVDCTNFANWLNINSGRIPEGGVLNNPSTNNTNSTNPIRSENGVPSGNYDTGDIVSRDGHVGVYLGNDEDYIYTFETSRRGQEDAHGTMISAVYYNKTKDPLPFNYYGPKYQENYWKDVTNISDVEISKPSTEFIKENVVLEPNNK